MVDGRSNRIARPTARANGSRQRVVANLGELKLTEPDGCAWLGADLDGADQDDKKQACAAATFVVRPPPLLCALAALR